MQPSQQRVPSPVNAQPILERLVDGLFPKAEHLRDEVCKLVEGLLQAMQVEGLVLQSSAHEHPCWVKVWCWMPYGNRLLTERAAATITIEPKPFHRFDLVYSVAWDNRGKTKSVPGMRQFTQAEATYLLQFLVSGNNEPDFSSLQVRQKRWQIWKPVNKIDAVDTDWLAILPVTLFLVGIFTLVFGIGFFLLIAGFVAGWALKRRTTVVRSSGKPLFEPRNLSRIDSWQTVISGAGADSQLIRQRFLEAIANPPNPHFRSTVERIWYWGLDTKEEREQIMLTFNRAVLFAQIYPYGRELYVGWDAHLNRGTWVEKTITSGIDRETGRLTHINTVVHGSQALTEYDVSDVSCLTEWAHAQLVRICKAYMAERRIDQEIDFKIIRGERQGIVGQSGDQPAAPATSFVKRLRKGAIA